MSFTYSETHEEHEEVENGSFNKRSSLKNKNYDSDHSETRKTVKFNDNQNSESEVFEVKGQRANRHAEAIYSSDHSDVIHMHQDGDPYKDMFSSACFTQKVSKKSRPSSV
jgi:hypothetical protein